MAPAQFYIAPCPKIGLVVTTPSVPGSYTPMFTGVTTGGVELFPSDMGRE
jgi:hypothetical protein